jgi:hypothetical protein
MPSNVFGKLLYRAVSPLRFFSKRHEDNLVEVARQLSTKFGGLFLELRNRSGSPRHR